MGDWVHEVREQVPLLSSREGRSGELQAGQLHLSSWGDDGVASPGNSCQSYDKSRAKAKDKKVIRIRKDL